MAAPIVCGVTRNTPKAVVRAASALAQQLACRLELVYVTEKLALRGPSRKERRRAGGELLTEMLCDVPAVVEAAVHLREGRAAEAIINTCAESEASLLVVGSPDQRLFRRRSPIHRLLAFGADCPLVIVPRQADPLGEAVVAESTGHPDRSSRCSWRSSSPSA